MSRSEQPVEEHPVWDFLRKHLPEIVVGALVAAGAIAAAVAIAACFASGACELGLVLAGLSVGLVLLITAALRAAGVRDAGGDNTPVAAADHQEESAAS